MKTIFLDLEETIIESMDSPKILFEQIEKIKHFISEDDDIKIFSFAIWEESDMNETVSNIISNHFGKFCIVFKNDLKPLFKNKFGIKDDLDFMDFSNDKETCFTLFIIDQIKNGLIKNDCIFFDDKISTIDLNIAGINVSLKNVKKLP